MTQGQNRLQPRKKMPSLRDLPVIDPTSYIDPTASVIGLVTIGPRVFVGPGAVIRADEANSQIIISADCNIQDRVVIHCLKNSRVILGEGASASHGCIIHGPCEIGARAFVGFSSVVFNAVVGSDTMIKHRCCVEGVTIGASRLVESGGAVTDQDVADGLARVLPCHRDFIHQVVMTNHQLVALYKDQA